ncbi:hypothetical protein HK097_003968 [Rhizophlyctis rosea]|uniref:Uncharacterized protein n=1 Tax=Rhizophlyctis rosea TaxID=64517 RepID=A0AAD5S3N3_9FUNG|nr:hypothetical protein HK097_003968 [Rhizophlyctis rosea]
MSRDYYDRPPSVHSPPHGNVPPVPSFTHMQRQLADVKARIRSMEEEMRSLRGVAERMETDIMIAMGRRGP